MKVNEVLDAKGLACPMPIVKTKKAMTDLEPGHVLEIQATDRGSIADLEAWSENMGHQYLGHKEDGDVLYHYVRKSTDSENKPEKKHDQVVSNEDLEGRLNDDITVLDVREPAEYEFGHIPGAVSVPLGELDEKADEIDKDKEVYVICRTGSRSDMAAQKLAEKGYNVFNVTPGMKDWNGNVEK
ncbi:Rhodanese-related sulfurtransferase [Thalassobacillus cyri]|uniref:Rhodanese-related sulfurtransferase n=1 Tax=Thalassobacillus cyri TaxID=571932 RepID=A0A1H4FSX3_9BACI|nr:sulfurtransferase TusA family protein [Thalassobacillus cyri]SEB00241.1 Rhodanese-related sulfurtransferase [Thalassobacillus cyri]